LPLWRPRKALLIFLDSGYNEHGPMAKRSKKKKSSSKTSPTAAASPHRPARLEEKLIIQVALIFAAVWWVYWPALDGDWIGDDLAYIPQNPLLRDPEGLWKIWFVPGSYFEYYPVEATVEWVQWQIWGVDTLGYHLTNVVLHLLGSLLVWRLLGKFDLSLAWVGGLLFALHPVQVESVAWMSELKNTLSLPPFLLAMCAWIDYEEHCRPRDYRLAVGLFFVAMLCKISMFLFPAVILLYAWWKRSRIDWKDLKSCAPFLLISVVLVSINFVAIKAYAQLYPITAGGLPSGGYLPRVAVAGLIFAAYFSHCVWPVALLPHYLKWSVNPPSFWQFWPWPVMAGIFTWCWIKRVSWGRHILLGLGFFLINLTPFLGFPWVSFMKFTWVMDHLVYLSLIGLIGLIVAGLGQILPQAHFLLRASLTGAIAMVAVLLAVMSRQHAELYTDEEALWSYTVHQDPDDWTSYTSLGNALVQKGHVAEAKAEYELALKINPDDVDAHNDLGNVLCQMGNFAQAIDQYRESERLQPDYAEAHNNLGYAMSKLGRTTEAIAQYREVLRLSPDNVVAHNTLGGALVQAGRVPEAMDQFRQAVQLKPDYAEAHNSLGVVLARMGRNPEAAEQFQAALDIDPAFANARNNLNNLNQRQSQTRSGP